MKKKILLIISMCLIALGLAACGETDPTTMSYNGYSYDQLKSTCEGTVTSLLEMADEQKEPYTVMKDMSDIERNNYIKSVAPGATEYVEMGEFTITKSGKTLECKQEITFTDRPVILSYVYKYHNMELEDIGVEAVQTLGEKMTNAALNTLMGMGIVFVVLILISLIIYGFKIFPYLENKKKANQAPAAPVAAPKPAATPAAPVAAQNDLELTAVIAAAIAASTGTSTSDFVVRSIRRR